MRLRQRSDPSEALAGVLRQPLAERSFLSRGQLARRFGADRADAELVAGFARQHSLKVVRTNLGRRTVVLTGSVARMSDAFAVQLDLFEHHGHLYRGRTGSVRLPAALAPAVEGVFGLDERRQARPHIGSAGTHQGASSSAAPGATAKQVAARYGLPRGLDGSGSRVAVIELGGQYVSSDLQRYCRRLRLEDPAIAVVATAKPATPSANDSSGRDDAEVALDLEVLVGIAPRAELAVYFGANTDQGFLEAVSLAIHARKTPDVISISWGSAETGWTQQSRNAFNRLFEEAALLGITVCCSSGDDGSGGGELDGNPHVELPASVPTVLACGGTELRPLAGRMREVVWNNDSGISGGGISEAYAVPDWQTGLRLPPRPSRTVSGRGVPDVAAIADGRSAYRVVIGGQWMTLGGTSAAAPLWAGVVACLRQLRGQRLGCINPLLYAAKPRRRFFNPITAGSNGAYRAARGWDACTGLGSPILSQLIPQLRDGS